ncbi:MAG TPA: GNAT family N-acetyltransferase [Hanamia sp.]|nr:GNAT family N-acetyltransferase [Hanamia sp.]
MIEIRTAQIEDLPVIRQLAHEIWPSAYLEILGQAQLDYMLEKIYSLPSLEHQFTVLNHNFILAIENETPVGFASYSAHEDEPIYHLNKIYVLPDQQGKKIGKKLLDHVLKAVKEAGASALQLNVNRYNKALHFYERAGFKIIRKEDIDIGSGYFMNDFVLEKQLEH